MEEGGFRRSEFEMVALVSSCVTSVRRRVAVLLALAVAAATFAPMPPASADEFTAAAALDGGILNFSDRPFYGSTGANPPAYDIVGVAAGRS